MIQKMLKNVTSMALALTLGASASLSVAQASSEEPDVHHVVVKLPVHAGNTKCQVFPGYAGSKHTSLGVKLAEPIPGIKATFNTFSTTVRNIESCTDLKAKLLAVAAENDGTLELEGEISVLPNTGSLIYEKLLVKLPIGKTFTAWGMVRKD